MRYYVFKAQWPVAEGADTPQNVAIPYYRLKADLNPASRFLAAHQALSEIAALR